MIIDNLSPFLIPYDKNGKYYRQPTNSVNKKNDKGDKSEGLYTCLGCLEKIPATDLDCPKCGKRTAAGKKVDFDKKWNSPAAKAKQKREITNTNFQLAFVFVGLIAIIGGCVAIFNQEYEPKRNPNLEGSVQDFDVCVKKQKRAGLSTDKCWDML